ncbi:MAG: hypothetical protein WAO74_00265 [Polaribacter sp.]|uniref:hypothetical protein n=1 Tax=Polaribacter sp. TaxID=1920175 RepID=UPI003BB07F07
MFIKKILIVFFIFFIPQTNIFCQQRTLYVDDFKNIIGNEKKENKLLSFAKDNKFTGLILYDLDKIDKKYFHLADNSKNILLVNFILKARKDYNIQEIGASGENGAFFIDEIEPYNKARNNPDEQFDVYNLEYEYWKYDSSRFGGYYCENYLRKNGIPCNRNGSYIYYKESLSIMSLLTKESTKKIKVEAYLGNFKADEIKNITKHVDRILISGFANTPKKSFKTVKKRLEIVSNCSCKPEVYIIFSSELEYMKGYLTYNSLDDVEKIFIDEMKKQNIYNKINFKGFAYYNYSMTEYAVNKETIRRTGIKN